ncbi:RNA-dependent DNA polymerase, partial [Photorhabdus sp. UCH-936]|nr:RNA-dependent DNA polymerase [Photorhabdus antumapuensis]
KNLLVLIVIVSLIKGKAKLLTLMEEEYKEVVSVKLLLLQDKLYMIYKDNPQELAEKIKTILQS